MGFENLYKKEVLIEKFHKLKKDDFIKIRNSFCVETLIFKDHKNSIGKVLSINTAGKDVLVVKWIYLTDNTHSLPTFIHIENVIKYNSKI